jgi:hypothetical protein
MLAAGERLNFEHSLALESRFRVEFFVSCLSGGCDVNRPTKKRYRKPEVRRRGWDQILFTGIFPLPLHRSHASPFRSPVP